MMNWDYYSKRRNVSIEKYVRGRNIKSYEQLVQTLEQQSILPPSREDFDKAYLAAYPPVVEKPKKVVKAAPKKPAAARKPAAKKPAAKPKKTATSRSRRRTSAKNDSGTSE